VVGGRGGGRRSWLWSEVVAVVGGRGGGRRSWLWSEVVAVVQTMTLRISLINL